MDVIAIDGTGLITILNAGYGEIFEQPVIVFSSIMNPL